MIKLSKIYKIILAVGLILIHSCKKFVEIEAPRTGLVKTTVFDNDATANSAMLGLYYHIRSTGFANGTSSASISFIMSLASDEQISYITGSNSTVVDYQQLNENSLLPNNAGVLRIWSDLYKCIFEANSILEGISSSSGLTVNLSKQLEGEAKFIRAFCNFYLVNLWGDIPLVTTTDYRINEKLSRESKVTVYQNIISDLIAAQSLLPSNYSFSNNERVRATKWAASSMLARVYLFMEDWVNAEIQSTSVISNSGDYSLVTDLNGVFLKNSSEAILQWWSDQRANDWVTFYPLTSPPLSGGIRPQFVNDFETGDLRKTKWIGSNGGYFGTLKYSSSTFSPPAEYSTVLRLAEQYLIRGEARARQGKITGVNSAESDINIIRNRAGLVPTTAMTQSQMLTAIEIENRAEFFNEWGHRWFDLVRTNRATEILLPIKSQWTQNAQLFPIPESEIRNNPNLTQNPGY